MCLFKDCIILPGCLRFRHHSGKFSSANLRGLSWIGDIIEGIAMQQQKKKKKKQEEEDEKKEMEQEEEKEGQWKERRRISEGERGRGRRWRK
jgi:signal transduction histidine kinase